MMIDLCNLIFASMLSPPLVFTKNVAIITVSGAFCYKNTHKAQKVMHVQNIINTTTPSHILLATSKPAQLLILDL